MKNSSYDNTVMLKQTNVVYEYNCNEEDCALLPKVSYIGMTSTTMSRRITMHLQNGAIKDHLNSKHPTIPLTDRRNILVNNTKVINKTNNLKL